MFKKMSILCIFSFVVLLLGQQIRSNPVRNIRDVTFANSGEFPFMVLLRTTRHICSGTIINEYLILTAAHCIYNRFDFVLLIHSPIIPNAAEFIIHPDWDENTFANDIALIRLEKNLLFDEFTQPIQLVPEGYNVPAGTDAIQVGWFSMNRIHKVDLTIISDNECSDFFRTKIEGKLICARTLTLYGKSCIGSGGPLIVDGFQVGVLSFGHDNCSELSYPDAYSEVSNYAKWISKTIEDIESQNLANSTEDNIYENE